MRVFIPVFLVALAFPCFAQTRAEEAKVAAYTAVTLGPWEIIYRDDVQADLGLAAETRAKLKEIKSETYAESTKIYRETPKGEARDKILALNKAQQEKVQGLVTPEQKVRIREIHLQLLGGAAALEPEVSVQLGITDEQKVKFAAIQEKRRAEAKAFLEKVRARQTTVNKGMVEMTKKNLEFDDELRKVLTPEQTVKLKSLLGKPFVPTPIPTGKGG
ncbi:MAG: hypothetical protein WAO58_05325 [Fimbriimonadaceae bacterium]